MQTLARVARPTPVAHECLRSPRLRRACRCDSDVADECDEPLAQRPIGIAARNAASRLQPELEPLRLLPVLRVLALLKQGDQLGAQAPNTALFL